ncbi:MAG: alpha/beta hydrolase, partial [Alphaproteobacteria bacterium]|nr:alpha/beta hydrolase [Alphaproteobacteria bacterium]
MRSLRKVLVLGGASLGLLVPTALGAGWVWQRAAAAHDLLAHPAPGALHTIDGRRMHIHCVGEGSPTVVLIAGLTGPGSVMGPLQRAISGTTRACTYDRPGLGYSDPIDHPRRAAATAEELVGLLDAAGIVEPAVLVGHSWGGMLARSVAAAHPERVAGIVLIDSSHEG